MPDTVITRTMQKLAAIVLTFALFSPAATAQSASTFTGRWEGTFKLQRPDGTEADPRPIVFDLTQKGKTLTGTAGPGEKQWKVEKGTVADGKASFEVQQPDGPLFKFSLAIVKGRLQGDMTGEREGVVRGNARVDAAKADAKGK